MKNLSGSLKVTDLRIIVTRAWSVGPWDDFFNQSEIGTFGNKGRLNKRCKSSKENIVM